jgi:hypothetical protein
VIKDILAQMTRKVKGKKPGPMDPVLVKAQRALLK